MKRLLAITDPGCDASTRYRVAQFENYFRAHGVQLEIFPCPREKNLVEPLLASVKAADVVVLQRILPRVQLLKKIRRHAARLVFDFDDAIIRNDSSGGRPWLKPGRWWRFRQVVRDCDAVTPGSAHLAALATKHADSHRIFPVPTVVDMARYEREPGGAPTPFALGWIGSRWTLPYLEQLRLPLEKVLIRHPEISVRVISDQRPNLGRTPVTLTRWSHTDEVRALKTLSIGLAPLPDDAWSRGKCGLRLLQYLAAGVPAVAAPVGTQKEIIRLGGALTARSPAEWNAAIENILAEKDLSAELSARGLQLAKDHFSLAVWASRVLSAWMGQ
jgi:hypothetical protein